MDKMKTANTLFKLISEGRTIGKRIKLAVPESNFGTVKTGSLNILQVMADDSASQQLSITIIPPGVIPQSQFPGGVLPPADTELINNSAGDRDNYSLYTSPNPSSNFSWVNAVALVEWGIGGVQSKVECDFLNGLCINLQASWVRVSVFIDAVKGDDTDITGCVIVLGAFIGPGYPKANNAQRTFNVGQVVANLGAISPGFPQSGFGNSGIVDPSIPPLSGDHNAYPIPYHAKQVFVTAAGDLTDADTADVWDLSLLFYRDVRTTILMGTHRFTPDNHTPVRIPNGAYYWTLHNHLPEQISNSSVIFDLSV